MKNRNFFLLWLAQIVTQIGDTLYSVGVMVNVYERTGSALQTTGVLIATTLPHFLLSPFAGAIVDKYSRKKVMIIMDIVRAVLVAALLLVVSETRFNLWGIYLVIAGLSAATAFYRPALMALIPSIVEPNYLVRANSVLMGTQQATVALGYIFGGLLALHINFALFVQIDLATFVVAAVLTAFIIVPPLIRETDEGADQPSLLASFRRGWEATRQHAVAFPLVAMETFEHIAHGIWTAALMLVFVEVALGGNADDWGYIVGAYCVGVMIGAFWASARTRLLHKVPGWIIIFNAFLCGVLTFIYAYSPGVVFAAVICFLYGPPMAVRDVTQDTLLQTLLPKDILGRVYALRNMLTNITFMLSGLFFSWMADHVDVRSIYLIGGVVYVLTAVYALSSKGLRESRIKTG